MVVIDYLYLDLNKFNDPKDKRGLYARVQTATNIQYPSRVQLFMLPEKVSGDTITGEQLKFYEHFLEPLTSELRSHIISRLDALGHGGKGVDFDTTNTWPIYVESDTQNTHHEYSLYDVENNHETKVEATEDASLKSTLNDLFSKKIDAVQKREDFEKSLKRAQRNAKISTEKLAQLITDYLDFLKDRLNRFKEINVELINQYHDKDKPVPIQTSLDVREIGLSLSIDHDAPYDEDYVLYIGCPEYLHLAWQKFHADQDVKPEPFANHRHDFLSAPVNGDKLTFSDPKKAIKEITQFVVDKLQAADQKAALQSIQKALNEGVYDLDTLTYAKRPKRASEQNKYQQTVLSLLFYY